MNNVNRSQTGRRGAFTLVELIVVITIVGILSTVGFVSYSGYLSGARDSNRFSQLTKLSDSLQVYAATKSLPLPDDYVEITASGASNVIAYQGYVGVDVLETIDYTNGGVDPKDDSFFTYYLTKDRKSMQLLTFMEEQSSVSSIQNRTETYAANYENRFPKTYGKKLGVLTQSITNIPVQEISSIINGSGYLDVINTTDEYIAHIGESERVTGTGAVISVLVGLSKSGGKRFSCKDLKGCYPSYGDGVYTVYSRGVSNVYCDMTTDGGGWSLLMKVDGSQSTFLADSPFWTNNVPYNEASYKFDNLEHKNRLFSRLGFDTISVRLKTGNTINTRNIEKAGESLLEVFSSNTPIFTNFGRNSWFEMVPNSYLQPLCNAEGINIVDPTNNTMIARIGIAGNNGVTAGLDPCFLPDSAIGVGLRSDVSAGNFCGSTDCQQMGDTSYPGGSSHQVSSIGYIFVR